MSFNTSNSRKCQFHFYERSSSLQEFLCYINKGEKDRIDKVSSASVSAWIFLPEIWSHTSNFFSSPLVERHPSKITLKISCRLEYGGLRQFCRGSHWCDVTNIWSVSKRYPNIRWQRSKPEVEQWTPESLHAVSCEKKSASARQVHCLTNFKPICPR